MLECFGDSVPIPRAKRATEWLAEECSGHWPTGPGVYQNDVCDFFRFLGYTDMFIGGLGVEAEGKDLFLRPRALAEESAGGPRVSD